MFRHRCITSNASCRTTALAADAAPVARWLIAAAVVAAALAGPSAGQAVPDPVPEGAAAAPPTAPKSLLPDSFGPTRDAPVAPAAPLALPPAANAVPAADATADAAKDATAAAAPEAGGPALGAVGPLTPSSGGYGDAAFAGSDGRFVAGLLRRLSTPIASRWAHIVLRRALLTQAAAPPGINPGDWIAERARTLLNMGEIDGAKALIDNLPIDHITPRLVRVAGQVHLAAADLGGLCPIADTGGAVSPDPLWKLAEAMCAAMAGDDITAASGFDGLRDGDQVDPFDIMLGERIATISGGGGRAANVEWDAVDHVTPYRFGVATAAGVAVPLPLLTKLGEATGGTSWGWVLHAPGQAADVRAAALRPAVAIGIASVDDMVGAISAASADLDRTALDASPAGTLRAAYAAATTADRVAAMRTIWASGGTEPDRYAAHIETALAAARLPVDAAVAADAPGLIAAMLGAGIEDHAAKWWPVVRGGDDAASRSAWALLAVGANGGIAVSPARFAAYAKDVPPHRAALLLAALDGLGHARGDGWQASRDSVGLVPVTNSWSEAIDAAAVSRRTGEVAVLAATGLQTRWTVVSPGYFAHIIAAYVAVGRVHEARMLAAEAVTRG